MSKKNHNNNHKPFGGFFDFNRNGKVELWEMWLADQMLREIDNSRKVIDITSEPEPITYDWRTYCEDGSAYGLSPYDYASEEEYEEVLAKAKYAWRDNYAEARHGISPENYETEEEYLRVLATVDEAIINAVKSVKLVFSVESEPEPEEMSIEPPEEPDEADYPNKRTYRAALELAYDSGQGNHSDTIDRSRFILDNPNIIATKYLTHRGTFLFGQAIKENFQIPISLPDEDEWAKTNLFDIIKGVSEYNIPLAIEIWDWCIDNFMPYIKYSSGFDKEILTVTVLAHFYEMPDNFAVGLVQYIKAKPGFSKKIIRDASDVSDYVYEILHQAILKKDYQTLSTVLEDVLSNENADIQTVTHMIDTLIYCCKTWKETETMNTFKKYVLPIFTALDSPEYREHIVNWNEQVSTYCQTVEEQIRRKETKERNKLQLRDLVDSMKNIISRIEQDDVWEQFDISTPKAITYQFTYPNGKNGDIDMFIATRYGQVEQIDAIQYSVLLPTIHKEQILLLEYIYAHSLHNDIPRNELDQFLYDYNLGHRLRQYCDDYIALGGDTETSEEGARWLKVRYGNESEEDIARRLNYGKIRSKAMEVANRYMDAICCQRNKVYAEIVEQGLTSARWTSEQKAYLIVKNLYPDTIFQYRADWLGQQSLDIYIPSMKIGIEYQGKQHFEGVSFFGGDEGLQQAQARDEAKKRKCIENGVRLIEWRYDAPLTEEYIRDKISEIDLPQQQGVKD